MARVIQRCGFHIVAAFILFACSTVLYAEENEFRFELLPSDMPIMQLTVACRTCHGHEGKTPMFPGIPTIGFQDREYLVMALQAFKNGERIINVDRSPLGLDMIKIVALLNDENIERIADYFATRPVWDMSRPVEYPASYVYPRGYESEEDDEQ